MKLRTKLTLSTSLIIIVVLSGYGYFKIISNRDMLIRKMKLDVMSIGRTMKVSLERIPLLREKEYFQQMIDAVDEYEQTLGIVVYHQEKDIVLRSHSLEEGIEPYLELIKRSIQEDRPQEEFGVYKNVPVFSYAFPIKDIKGKNIGGVTILHHTGVSEDAFKLLVSYSWPGNVRELENIIQRAITLSQHEVILPDDLPASIIQKTDEKLFEKAMEEKFTLDQLEKEYIKRILVETGGNKSKAAERLGLDRKTLYRKLEEL